MNTRRTSVVVSIVTLWLFASTRPAPADGPKDNSATDVRPVPPPGNELAPADREALQAGADALGKEVDSLRAELKDKPQLLAYLPDVQIFHNAVRYPLAYHETIDPGAGRKAIADGLERAKALHGGKAPWAIVSGPRGYVSVIDGSVQPYVLNLPADYQEPADDANRRPHHSGEAPESGSGGPGVTGREATSKATPFRLDVSCHGRDETLTELKFIQQKTSTPRDKLVLNLYGRYCNANKFAGEIDCLEAMDDVKRHYPIDENRILMIGFSMGGAACWQFAVHYTDYWAAASPGAGFAETREFLKVFQNEKVAPPWYEQALWHWYDCTDYAANLYNLPTIAYAGEDDPQKQASDVMKKAMEAEGLKLDRIIGPHTKHAYEKNAKVELDRRLDEILTKGRNPVPEKVRLTTWTLKYNHMYWLALDGLESHWHRARADAEIKAGTIEVKTENVSRLLIAFGAGLCPFPPGARLAIFIDGTKLEGEAVSKDKFLYSKFVKVGGAWKPERMELDSDDNGLRKRHGHQGPIDDAFMDPFLIVRPTGKPLNEKVGEWEKAECQHAIDHWRKQFRGEAKVKNDDQVTEADIKSNHLVLFGDPSSNKLLGRLTDKLPIKWTAQAVKLGDRSFSADNHVPVLIYPNPLHPTSYVVLNSGFTFREYDYLNNARQVPKLPDYAVIDVNSPPTPRAPGGVVAAGFFGERWELLPDDGKSAVDVELHP